MSAVWAAAGRAGERAAAGRGLAVAARRRDRRRPAARRPGRAARWRTSSFSSVEAPDVRRSVFTRTLDFNDLTSVNVEKPIRDIHRPRHVPRNVKRGATAAPATGNEACLGAKEASRSVPTVEAANEVCCSALSRKSTRKDVCCISRTINYNRTNETPATADVTIRPGGGARTLAGAAVRRSPPAALGEQARGEPGRGFL